jgi:LmbE family N-acetylglucosaminyl deacetylase
MSNSIQHKFFIFLFLIPHQYLFCQTNVTFSIQAHADDWQLFMSSNIIDDASDHNNKVVFITFTAGDAGHGADKFSGSDIPYYLAREIGSVYSSKFIADVGDLHPDNIPQADKMTFSYKKEDSSLVQHTIARYYYKNSINYFLRLPDGNRHGTGFKKTNDVSLQKMREGSLEKMKAIDGSTTYENWDDLVKTIRQIILFERGDDEQVWVNCASVDTRYNPNNHSDHRHASLAVREAVGSMNWIGIASWMSYASRKKRANLNDRQHENAAAVFAIYNWGLLEHRYYSNFNQGHQWWLSRDYFKITPPTGFFSDKKVISDSSATIAVPMIVTYSNPVRLGDKIDLSTEMVEKGQVEVELINLNGQILKSKKLTVREGTNNFSIPTDKLIAGMYVIRLNLNNKYIQSKKVVLID